MKAITYSKPGGPEVLHLTELSDPVPTPNQLLIRVRATALNRADLLQRKGKYPQPPGESEILGLEIAGEVEAMGFAVRGFAPGDRVFSLVGGGGYAERAVVDHRMAMRIPEGWSFTKAAAVPEAFFTAQEILFTLGNLNLKETVLIHAAAGGVGTAAIQLARETRARVLVTAGSKTKILKTLKLGANSGCNYKEQDFASWVEEVTNGCGVDLILDPIGAPHWHQNLQCLGEKGRLVLFGLMGGAKTNVNLASLLTKQITIFGTVLRSRPLEEKIAITHQFQKRWLPLLVAGAIYPVVDSSFPLELANQAHAYMEQNNNVGKIILEIR
jgi:putative PIG3 family NAD(P)H quinone oxidoreductase